MNNNNLNPNFVLVPVAVPNQEVVTYSNAATDKARILTENRNKSGIYSWTKINGKVYIGSAQNISKRFNQYFNPNYLEVLLCLFVKLY